MITANFVSQNQNDSTNSKVLELQDYMKIKVKPIIEPMVISLVYNRPKEPVLL